MDFHRRRSGRNDAWGRVFVLLIVLFVGLFFVDRFIGLDGLFQPSSNDLMGESSPTPTQPLVFATREEYVFVAPTEVPLTPTPQPTPTRTPMPYYPIELVQISDGEPVERSLPISVIGQCEEPNKTSRYIAYDPVTGGYRTLTDSIPYLVQPKDAWTLALRNGVIQRNYPEDFVADFPLPVQWQTDLQYRVLAISASADAAVVQRWETEKEALYWLSRGSDSILKLMELPNSLEEFSTDRENEWLFLRYLGDDGGSELTGIDLTTGTIREFTNFQKPNAYGGTLSWDGVSFAYWTEEGVWVIKVDGSFGALVFPDAQQPSWSPAGDQLVMVKDSRLVIGTINEREGTQAGVLQLPIRGNDPIWSADGNELLYWRSDRGDCTLFSWDLVGGFEQEIFRTQNSTCASAEIERWSLDGTSVLLTLPVTTVFSETSGDILCHLPSAQCQYLRLVQGNYPCRNSVWSETPLPFHWYFEDGLEGWYIIQQLSPLRNENGAIVAQSQGETPVINSPKALDVNADAYPYIEITMRVSGGSQAEINFATDEFPGLVWQRIIPFAVNPDGEMHRYMLDLRDFSPWMGVVNYLRLRPTNQSGVEIEIQSIRILSTIEEMN